MISVGEPDVVSTSAAAYRRGESDPSYNDF